MTADPDWLQWEDAWRPAREAIFGRKPPDLKPLAELLRSDIPVSPGMRDALAELLDPRVPAIYDLRLEIKKTSPPAYKSDGGFQLWLRVARAFRDERQSGTSYEEAAAIVGEDNGIDPRHVRRLIKKAEKFLARLRGED